MPRDLHALVKEDDLQGMPELTKSPDQVDLHPESNDGSMTADDEQRMISDLAQNQRNDKRDELHPYTQSLNLSDVDSCTRVEEEAFPPHERATREKFEYRLKTCSSLSLGIFTSATSPSIPTAATANPVYTGAPARKAVLLGHLIGTKTTNPTVTDHDMALPDPTRTSSRSNDSESPRVGHKEDGRTICIHSLAILPEYQRRGLGGTLLEAYLQRMENQGVADRAALIAHEEMIPFYERYGFVNHGQSQCQFGGGGWFDMVKELKGDQGAGLLT